MTPKYDEKLESYIIELEDIFETLESIDKLQKQRSLLNLVTGLIIGFCLGALLI